MTILTAIGAVSAGISYAMRHPDKMFRRQYEGTLNTSTLLIAGRLGHIRQLCESSIAFDKDGGGGLSNRAWLAQSVLNILDGSIDEQILEEAER